MKTKIAIVVLIILIISLISVSYFYSKYNIEQVSLLTSEANKILELGLKDINIDFEVKTEKNYAEVEDSIKEYISKLKNIYVEMEQMASGINPDVIFSGKNIENKKFDKIHEIIKEYKEKSQNLIKEYEQLITDEMVTENIKKANISTREDYYIGLYNEVMLSETMKNEYIEFDEDIKNEKGRLYEKLNKVEKMIGFLEEYEDSWAVEGNKIQFKNTNRMTEYYSLFNQIVD